MLGGFNVQPADGLKVFPCSPCLSLIDAEERRHERRLTRPVESEPVSMLEQAADEMPQHARYDGPLEIARNLADMVKNGAGVGLGRTPLRAIKGGGKTVFNMINPQEDRRLRITLRYSR